MAQKTTGTKPVYDDNLTYLVRLNKVVRKSPGPPVIYKPLPEHRFSGKALNSWVPHDAIDTAEPV